MGSELIEWDPIDDQDEITDIMNLLSRGHMKFIERVDLINDLLQRQHLKTQKETLERVRLEEKKLPSMDLAECSKCDWKGEVAECGSYKDSEGWEYPEYTVNTCPDCSEDIEEYYPSDNVVMQMDKVIGYNQAVKDLEQLKKEILESE